MGIFVRIVITPWTSFWKTALANYVTLQIVQSAKTQKNARTAIQKISTISTKTNYVHFARVKIILQKLQNVQSVWKAALNVALGKSATNVTKKTVMN